MHSLTVITRGVVDHSARHHTEENLRLLHVQFCYHHLPFLQVGAPCRRCHYRRHF
jgi:hypothetical protein